MVLEQAIGPVCQGRACVCVCVRVSIRATPKMVSVLSVSRYLKQLSHANTTHTHKPTKIVAYKHKVDICLEVPV